jgi:hypothetical protein
MSALASVHSRITSLLSSRIGEEAAELEFKMVVNRTWFASAGAITVIYTVVASSTRSWTFGGLAIGSFASITVFLIRGYFLRFRFFAAASTSGPNALHPGRHARSR